MTNVYLRQYAQRSGYSTVMERVPCLCQFCGGKFVTRYIRRKHAGICSNSEKDRSAESQLLPRNKGEQIQQLDTSYDDEAADSCSDGHDISNIEEPSEVR